LDSTERGFFHASMVLATIVEKAEFAARFDRLERASGAGFKALESPLQLLESAPESQRAAREGSWFSARGPRP
jgi:hypothetical protein